MTNIILIYLKPRPTRLLNYIKCCGLFSARVNRNSLHYKIKEKAKAFTPKADTLSKKQHNDASPCRDRIMQTVFVTPAGKVITVKTGFSWLGFLFGWFYWLIRGMFTNAALLFIMGVFIIPALSMTPILGPIIGFCVAIFVWFWVGFNTNKLLVNHFTSKGYTIQNKVTQS